VLPKIDSLYNIQTKLNRNVPKNRNNERNRNHGLKIKWLVQIRKRKKKEEIQWVYYI